MEQYIHPHEADSSRLLLHTFSSYLFLCFPPLCTDVQAHPLNEHYHKQGIPLKSSHTDVGKVIYYKIRLITHMEFTTAHSKTISVWHDYDFIIAASARSSRIWFLRCLFVNVCTLKAHMCFCKSLRASICADNPSWAGEDHTFSPLLLCLSVYKDKCESWLAIPSSINANRQALLTYHHACYTIPNKNTKTSSYLGFTAIVEVHHSLSSLTDKLQP